jgi:hypothetical protein
MLVVRSASRMHTIVNMDLQVALVGRWYWVVRQFPCVAGVRARFSSHLMILLNEISVGQW